MPSPARPSARTRTALDPGRPIHARTRSRAKPDRGQPDATRGWLAHFAASGSSRPAPTRQSPHRIRHPGANDAPCKNSTLSV